MQRCATRHDIYGTKRGVAYLAVKLEQALRSINLIMKKTFKKITIFMTMVVLSSTLMLSAFLCGPNHITSMRDFYGEVSFELPFRVTRSNYSGDLFFGTNYTLEQMHERIVAQEGHGARIYGFMTANSTATYRMLIYVEKGAKKHYFMMFANEGYPGNFSVTNGGLFIRGLRPLVEQCYYEWRRPGYNMLFPMHLAVGTAARRYMDENNAIRVWGDFEQIANFYSGTGRDNVTVDKYNQTITFFAVDHIIHTDPNFIYNEISLGWYEGYVQMQWVEYDNGNRYVYFTSLHVSAQ